MNHQLSFDGREIAGIISKFGEVELDSVPTGLKREDLAGLEVGDEIVTVVRWRLEGKNHGEKSDRQGFGVKPFLRKLVFRQLSVDFKIMDVDKAGMERKSRLTEKTA